MFEGPLILEGLFAALNYSGSIIFNKNTGNMCLSGGPVRILFGT